MTRHAPVLFITILGVTLFSCRGLAQEEDNVMTATSALQDVLSNLKQSVEKLSLDNDQLAARDNAMKEQILQLQTQLGQLQDQGNLLNKVINKLQDKNPSRAEQIARLEQENYDLDDRTQKSEGAIKLIQQSLGAGYQEDQKLLLQLKGMQNLLPVDLHAQPSTPPVAARQQKEKLKLMKMIYDSEQRQEALHESILEIQKNTPLLPAASALAHQQLLKEQIKDLQDQMAAYPPEKFSSDSELANQWDDTQLRQLEEELKDLEQNYAQLKTLMGQMDIKAQSSKLTVSQRVEGDKLQSSIDDLKRQGAGLRADLDDLRSQMVDLDKRKSRLEAMIQHQS